MNEPIDSYLDKMDAEAEYHDSEPPTIMTLEKAHALISADADRIGMAETLIESAYFVAYEDILKDLRGTTSWLHIASVIIRLNIPTTSQVDGTALAINYLSRGCNCPHCRKPIERVRFRVNSGLRVGHTAPFVHGDCYVIHEGTREEKRAYYAKQILEGKVRRRGHAS